MRGVDREEVGAGGVRWALSAPTGHDGPHTPPRSRDMGGSGSLPVEDVRELEEDPKYEPEKK